MSEEDLRVEIIQLRDDIRYLHGELIYLRTRIEEMLDQPDMKQRRVPHRGTIS